MFVNKKSNIVLSILVAIVLWMYVIGQVNPQTTIKIADIPITYLNEEELSNRYLAVSESQAPTVSITIEGPRADIKKVKKENIIATIDVGDMEKGKNSAEIAVQISSNVNIVKIDPETVVTNIEDKVSKKKTVKVSFKGQLDSGLEPGGIEINPKEITISGAESTVEKVDHISAKVYVRDIKDGQTNTVTKAIPVDKDGNEVKHISMSSQKVDVKATIYETKEVPLKVNTIGTINSSVELEEIITPETITIKGPKSLIEKIESVQGQDIDISDLKASQNFEIKPILEKNVEVSNKSKSLSLVVKIKQQTAIEVEKSSGDIKIENLGSGLKANISDTLVKATIKGKASIISGFTKDDLILSVNLKDLIAGEYDIAVAASSGKELGSIAIAPKTVKVIIKEEE